MAIFMPMKPAMAEAIAPRAKTRDTHQPSWGITPRTTATTAANMVRTRYSRHISLDIPKALAPEILDHHVYQVLVFTGF
jgi:hypothetical protein